MSEILRYVNKVYSAIDTGVVLLFEKINIVVSKSISFLTQSAKGGVVVLSEYFEKLGYNISNGLAESANMTENLFSNISAILKDVPLVFWIPAAGVAVALFVIAVLIYKYRKPKIAVEAGREELSAVSTKPLYIRMTVVLLILGGAGAAAAASYNIFTKELKTIDSRDNSIYSSIDSDNKKAREKANIEILDTSNSENNSPSSSQSLPSTEDEDDSIFDQELSLLRVEPKPKTIIEKKETVKEIINNYTIKEIVTQLSQDSLTLRDDLIVRDSAQIGGFLEVSGYTYSSGNLLVGMNPQTKKPRVKIDSSDGSITFDDTLQISHDNNNAYIQTLTGKGDIIIHPEGGDVFLNTNLKVTGGNAEIAASGKITSKELHLNHANTSDKLLVEQEDGTDVFSISTDTPKIVINAPIESNGDITTLGNLTVTGDIAVSGNQIYTGGSTFGGNLTVNADSNLNGNVTVTGLLSGGNITDSGLTATRVTFAGTGGLLSDDADLTFATDTLSATKLLSSTSVSTPSLISIGAIGITPAAGSNLNVSLSTTGDFAVNTNQLYVDTSTGNVGVGTTMPSGILHVAGQCVTADTRLRRRRKKKSRTGESEDDYEYDEVMIKDVTVGDEIASMDPFTGTLVWSRIMGLMDMGIKEIWKLTTQSGRAIRTTAEHPYFVRTKYSKSDKTKNQKLYRFEVDMSMKIEDFNHDTIVAIANAELVQTIIINRKVKQILRDATRCLQQPRKFNAVLYALAIVRLLAQFPARVHELAIDMEYIGYEKLISHIILSKYPDIEISFWPIGKKSPAHRAAEAVRAHEKTADLTAAETSLLAETENALRATVFSHSEGGKSLVGPQAFLSSSIDETDNLVKSGEWIKVRDIKVGGSIAVAYGDRVVWEKVVGIALQKPERVYDIEIEGTRNFVGNDIIAHNTAIFGAGEGGMPTTTTIRGAAGVGTNIVGANLTMDASNGTGTGGSGAFIFRTAPAGSTGAVANTLTERMRIDNTGNVGIGQTTPTAVLHIKAGTATASTAPLKFASGALLTTPEAGAVEFLTDAYYGTITTGAARRTFAFLESPTFTGTVTIPTPFTLGAVSVTTTGTQLNYLNASTGTTGTTSTNLVFSTSPTLVTPNIGVATATSIAIGANTLDTNEWANLDGVNQTLATTSTPTFSSLTLSNPLTLSNGGTSASLTASTGGIIYSGASAMAILSGTATANQILMSGAAAAPAWSTATYPGTTTINQLLYSSAANTVTGLASANSGVLVTSGTGVPSIATDIPTAVTIGSNYIYRVGGTDVAVADGGTGVGSWTNGQLLIGNTTGNTAALGTLTGTSNQITVTNGASSITLSTPQDIATTSTPQFARLGLGTAADATNILTATSASTADLAKTLNITHTGAITGTGYAGYFSKTGVSTTNVGLYATASGATNNYAAIFEAGNVGIGQTTPTAVLHLKAGTATASTAPLKFASGALLTTAEAGAVEFLTDAFYGTITTGAARRTFAFLESPTFTGTVTLPTPFTLGATSVTTTGTQLNYLNAATGTTGTTSTNLVFSTSPTLVTPALGTPTALVLTNATGLPAASVLAGTFGTGAYTMDTSLTVPTIIGGTATTSDLNLKTTSGIGVTGADMHFLVGNNGATEAMTILNSGNVGIGTTGPGAPLHIKSSNGAMGFLLEQGDTSKPQWLGVGAENLATAGAVQIEFGVAGAADEFFSGTTQGDMVLKAYTQANNKKFFIGATNVSSTGMVLQPNGNVGIGQTTPTAILHLKAGTATASTAPLKFASGALLTTAEAGAVEFLTDAYYGTITTGAARRTFAFLESPTFTGTVTLPTPFTLGAVSVTTTGTQLNYLNAATGTTGTTSTNLVFSTSPTLVTPNIGVATATSIAIGANTLDTNEWANLDGVNQTLATTSTPQFARLGLGTAADATNILTATSASTADLAKTLNITHTGAITGTGYAGYFSKTGVSTTNVGLYATASGATNNYAAIFEGGNVGIGQTTPTAILHLKAGTATASTAPLKFASGALLTTAEAGAVEFLTDAYYGTITTGAARKTFAFLESPTFTGTVTIPTPFTLGAVSVTTTGTQLNYLNAATGTTGTTSTNLVFSTSPTLITPALGTPSALVLTNATGLPAASVLAGTFGTGAYTMDTSLTVPTIVGGTATTSDLNLKTTSGIGATGADMHFLVGNNGATEAMTILNDGKVGIGNVAPAKEFHVTGAALTGLQAGDAYDMVYIENNDHARITINTPNNKSGVLQFNDSDGAARGYVAYDHSFDGIQFGTSGTEKVRINDTGNVGIGQTTPTAVLHLKAGTATASTAPLKFASGALLTTAEAGAVEFLTDAYYGTITTGAARKTFAFLESPTFTGTVTLPTPFTLGAVSVTTTGTQLNYLNASTGTTGTTSTNLVFSTSPTLITPALGTPSALVLTNATGLPAASVLAGTFGTGAYTMDTSLTVPTIVGGTATTSDLNLKTTSGIGATGADMHFLVGNNGATEAMTILNDGKVGIGTATPGYKFDVLSSGTNYTQAHFGMAADAGAYILSTQSDQAIIGGGANYDSGGWRAKFTSATTYGGYMVTSGDFAVTTDTGLTAGNTFTPSIRLLVNSSGNVGIGTTTPTSLLNLKGTLSSALTGTVSVTINTAAVTGVGTAFTTELAVGDSIKIGSEIFTVSAITDATNLTLDSNHTAGASGATAYRDPTLFAIDNGDAVNKLTVTRSGNVGIGVTSPTYILDVNGTGRFGTSALIGTGIASGYYQDTTNGAYRAITSTGDVGYYFQTISGAATTMYIGLYGSYSGNVGIGTVTPGFKLEVSGGRIRAVPTAEAYAIGVSRSEASSETFWLGVNAGGAGGDFQLSDSSGNSLITVTDEGTTGKVGIGTTSPQAQLEIAGGSVNTYAYVQSTGSTYDTGIQFIQLNGDATTATNTNRKTWYQFIENTTGKFQISQYFPASSINTQRLTIDTAGNVGIGAASPTAHLQIDGNISASAWTTDGIAFDSNAATYTDTSTAALGTVAVRTANSFGAPTFASTNAITVTDAFTLYVPKPIAGTNTTITRANSAYFEGNVGIGTTTPASLLHVSAATATFTLGNSSTQHLEFIGRDDTDIMEITAKSAEAAPTDINFKIANTAGTENSVMYMAGSTGNVGIGTAGPGALLELEKSQNAITELRVDNPDNTGAGAYSSLQFYQGATQRAAINSINDGFTTAVGGADALQIWNFVDGNIVFGHTTGGEKLRIQSNGEVGIGTTAPNGKLDVRDGNLVITDADVAHGITGQTGTETFFKVSPLSATAGGALVDAFSDDTTTPLYIRGFFGATDPTDTTAAIILDANKRSGTSSQALGALETVLQITNAGVTSPALVTVLGSGNVGIGTTGPTYNLEVSENSALASTYTDFPTIRAINLSTGTHSFAGLEVSGNNTTVIGNFLADGLGTGSAISGSDAGVILLSRSNHILALGTNDTEKMRIDTSGNVGIGTTTPTAHLQIDGNISASAWTTDGIAFDSNAATYTDTSTAGAGTVAVRTANSFGAPTFASTNAITVTDAFTLYVPKPIAGTNTTITRANSAYFEGNVGIGTTTPGAKLTVEAPSGGIAVTDGGSNRALIGDDGASGGYIQLFDASGNLKHYFRTDGGDSYFNAGNVGINDTTPDARLDVEPTGAVTATNYAQQINNLVTNATTDGVDKYGLYISSTGAFTGSTGTATNNYGLYIGTTSGGDNNYDIYAQSGANLTTAGTWTNAPSYRRYKDQYNSTASYLDKLMTLDVYEWQYKNETIDGMNRFKADSNRHASPFLDDFYQTFKLGTDKGFNIQDLAGVAIASVKELNTRFINKNEENETKLNELTLKVNQNYADIQSLQSAPRDQAAPVPSNQFTTTELIAIQGILGMINQTDPANVNMSLTGTLSSKTVETQSLAIKNTDDEQKTIGEAIITPVTTDTNNDGIDDITGSDGKSIVVKTKAVGEKSKVFVTASRPSKIGVTSIIPQQEFKIEIDEPATSDLKINWWVIEEK